MYWVFEYEIGVLWSWCLLKYFCGVICGQMLLWFWPVYCCVGFILLCSVRILVCEFLWIYALMLLFCQFVLSICVEKQNINPKCEKWNRENGISRREHIIRVKKKKTCEIFFWHGQREINLCKVKFVYLVLIERNTKREIFFWHRQGEIKLWKVVH